MDARTRGPGRAVRAPWSIVDTSSCFWLFCGSAPVGAGSFGCFSVNTGARASGRGLCDQVATVAPWEVAPAVGRQVATGAAILEGCADRAAGWTLERGDQGERSGRLAGSVTGSVIGRGRIRFRHCDGKTSRGIGAGRAAGRSLERGDQGERSGRLARLGPRACDQVATVAPWEVAPAVGRQAKTGAAILEGCAGRAAGWTLERGDQGERSGRLAGSVTGSVTRWKPARGIVTRSNPGTWKTSRGIGAGRAAGWTLGPGDQGERSGCLARLGPRAL
jgi:uncharacterized membrane protein (UPF0127 family)